MPFRKAILASAITALLWTCCCLVLARHYGFPEPAVHDEFGYVLGADTFLHGRIANPPHPMARFFESAQIFVQPAYASKYPPAQSLFLAIGGKLFGNLYYGVVISGALTIFLLTLLLTLNTGIVAGLIVSVVIGGVFLPPMYWAWSYWGGFVAASGGAALVLAIHFLRRKSAVIAGILFGAAVTLLFLSRPYEGGLLTIAVLAVEGAGGHYRSQLRRFTLAAPPLIVICLIFTTTYDKAVTGNAFELPHVLHDRLYNAVANFWILPAPPDPHIQNARVAALQGRESSEFTFYMNEHHAPLRIASSQTLLSLWAVFGWTAVFLILAPYAWRDAEARRTGTILIVCIIGLGMTTFHIPHYGAPVVAIVAFLMARIVSSALRFRSGRVLTAAAALIIVAATVGNQALTWRYGAESRRLSIARPDVIHRLSDMDGEHLVVVRYPSPGWNIDEEWVYNSADIDAQKIVFAHDLGDRENAVLTSYYGTRRKWLLTFEGNEFRLTPYLPGLSR